MNRQCRTQNLPEQAFIYEILYIPNININKKHQNLNPEKWKHQNIKDET